MKNIEYYCSNSEYNWRVVPVCDKQKLDVKKSDLLNGGLYRKCNVYKSGGGYDLFPEICEKFLGNKKGNQFVVQLYGCALDCPYCYVTRDGIWSDYVSVPTSVLVRDFLDSKQEIFHLMGGSPAIYIDKWYEILDLLPKEIPFTSDLLLIEDLYKKDTLKKLSTYENIILAVSVKGSTEDEFKINTNKKLNKDLFDSNLSKIISSGIKYYLTFTGMSIKSIDRFKDEYSKKFGKEIFENSYGIDLINYNALN